MPRKGDRIRGNSPEIIQAARELRQRLTPAEVRLWNALKNRQINGLRFRCQHPVQGFIVDFYCPACRLVIEVDGSVHDSRGEYDTARTEKLETFGYRVLRFGNEEVMENLDKVVERIVEGLGFGGIG
ncbi:endonuclease domain-containing protein [Synechococcus sp. PCC 7336]|uniref:endonuclease domain-containing protein n=1 Tax=Synechococcus sp. PCC 7336 TaxID=195250 RepID=UPI00034AB4E2|nr:DUF559 domain-containing protein [Synechococcus sp. PCC 7336]